MICVSPTSALLGSADSDADLDSEFVTADLPGKDRLSLREIYGLLGRIYRGSIGAEFSHITSTAERVATNQRETISSPCHCSLSRLGMTRSI